MKFKTLILMVLLLVGSQGRADEGHSDEDRGRLKALMHVFLIELEKLSPFLNSEEAFKSDKAKLQVSSSLAILEKKVRNAPEALKDNSGFRINFSLLADHIVKTKAVFEKGEMAYARMRLNGTTQLCASCHLQTPKVSKFSPFSDLSERTHTSNFNNASFLFVIRRYPEALSMFDELARKYPQSQVTPDQLSDLYRRKLAIFARVSRNPKQGVENFKEDLKNKNLPADVRQNIIEWSSGFEKWNNETNDPSNLSTPELIAFVEKNLPGSPSRNIAPSDPKLLTVLRMSGLLYERLYAQPSSEHAQALLYFLALYEASLSPVYFYSVGDIYLKECVVRYPKKKYSKKCYEAYRDGISKRFSGLIPEPFQQSIEAMKDYL